MCECECVCFCVCVSTLRLCVLNRVVQFVCLSVDKGLLKFVKVQTLSNCLNKSHVQFLKWEILLVSVVSLHDDMLELS